MTNETQTTQARYLAGRCANGAERDGGTLFHAVPAESWKALCGSQPGRRSAGWGTPWKDEQPVTCPRCLKRMKTNVN